jgi:hypothetical protein
LQKCARCHQIIHPNFAGRHKRNYANCPICKEAITNSEYWSHIRSHPGHKSDVPLRKNVDDFRKNIYASTTPQIANEILLETWLPKSIVQALQGYGLRDPRDVPHFLYCGPLCIDIALQKDKSS